MQIFDFRFLMELHVLGCPEHGLTISGKCLSLCAHFDRYKINEPTKCYFFCSGKSVVFTKMSLINEDYMRKYLYEIVRGRTPGHRYEVVGSILTRVTLCFS